MTVHAQSISLNTRGNADMQDITSQVSAVHREKRSEEWHRDDLLSSSTTALTTVEFESGCVNDLRRLFEEILPADREYAHNTRWGDGNGHSHARAALLGASLTVPFMNESLTLGTWQQIVHVDFDTRPRNRELIVLLIGE